MKTILHSSYAKGAFLLLMASLLCFSFYDYSFRNEKRIESNLRAITKENNEQTTIAISEKLKDEIRVLQAYAMVISQYDDITGTKAFQDLEPLLESHLFTRIAITMPDGISYTSDHYQHDSSTREYYLEGMKGNSYVSDLTTSTIDQSDVIIMSVPVYKETGIAGVLRATISTTRLKEYFQLSFLSGSVSSFIIQSDGTNLTPEDNYHSNFFTMLSKNNNETTILEQMKQELANGEKGSITFQLNGKTRYAYYCPIELTQWHMLTVLPYSTVQQEMGKDFSQTILLAIKISSILLVTCIYFLYLQRKGARHIEHINKQLDAVISNTPGSSYKHEMTKPESIQFFKQDDHTMAGYTKNEILELIHNNLLSLIFKEDYDILRESLKNLKLNTVVSNTYRIIDKHKKVKWFYDQRQIIQENNKLMYYVEVLDITEMRMTQEQLKISEERYQLILKETQSVIFEWNMHTDQISFSDLWTSKYGYPNHLEDFLILTQRHYGEEPNSYIPLIEALISGSTDSKQMECLLSKANGEKIWVKIFAKAISDAQGYLLRIVGSISDISQEKQRSMQLLERAQRDGLTKVYNRITIESLINKELESYPEEVQILFVIDIDDFKSINDTLGHTSGDEALSKFSSALVSCFRNDDIIGRIGGDEFVVFMKHLDGFHKEQIERKSKLFLSAISKIHLSQDENYQIHCSIGIATHPKDGCTYMELFTHADKRMYRAKKQGKNTYIYTDE